MFSGNCFIILGNCFFFLKFLQICMIFGTLWSTCFIVLVIHTFEIFRFSHSFILSRYLPHLASCLCHRLIILLDTELKLSGTQFLILLTIASFYWLLCVEYDINFINSTYIYWIPTVSQTVFYIPGQQQWKKWRKSLFSWSLHSSEGTD